MVDVVGIRDLERGSIEGRSISMYPHEWAIVHQLAKDIGLNRSAGIRWIIHEWQRLKAEEWARQQRLRIIEAHRGGYITDAEKDEALRLLSVGGELTPPPAPPPIRERGDSVMKAAELQKVPLALLETQAAKAWLAMARRCMMIAAYVRLYNEAVRIAHERRATRLGKIHCELALKKLSQQEIE